MKKMKFDGHDFYYEKGMTQIDSYYMNPEEPVFGNTQEVWICEMIVKHLQPDWNFLDVGSHFGQFAMVAAKRTDGTVFCFEPVSHIFPILEQNAELFDNMFAYKVALLDELGEESFFITQNRLYGGSHKVTNNGGVKVKCAPLDHFKFKVDMMNIDVEGSGDRLIKGAEKTLENVKVIIFEEHNGEDEYRAILTDAGFELQQSPAHNRLYLAVRK